VRSIKRELDIYNFVFAWFRYTLGVN
jgi:hypothetical protein